VVVDMCRSVLPRVLGFCGFGDLRAARALVLVVASAMLFGYFAIPALEETDPLAPVDVTTAAGPTSG
jgi:hypothetical protein